MALDQVLPIARLMRLQLFQHAPWHMVIQTDIGDGLPIRLAVSQVRDQKIDVEGKQHFGIAEVLENPFDLGERHVAIT